MLYTGSQVLFESSDEGTSWQPISPDLTRNDASKMGSSGGPLTQDNTGVEYYCTIFTVDEGRKAGTIWCGSDDGLVHVTQDSGKTWANVTPPSMPEWMQINCIASDPHRDGGAYIAGTRYKLDDFRPYLYRTEDYGKTWTEITGGLGKIGQDVALMALRGEDDIRMSGGGGSSAMPHKQNPLSAERLVTLARFNATLISGLHQSLVHEQERSGAAWTLEWLLLPQMCQATGASLTASLGLFGSIERIGTRS